MDCIYYEQTFESSPTLDTFRKRFPEATFIPCERYTEVFNPKSQNFRIQKQNPALILAQKYQNWVLPTPEGYGIGGNHNYYFSHLLNCVYDCRYCFLQGMFRSANYVLFANFEDFQAEIRNTLDLHPGEDVYFFSGYDCDSLALETYSGFVQSFLPFFTENPRAFLELRTKSHAVGRLLQHTCIPNVVAAFTLSPQVVIENVEHGTPSLEHRLRAMEKLQEKGWKIGLRFDPLLYIDDFKSHYHKLFETVFSRIKLSSIHSVSLGIFRLPKGIYNNIRRLYPKHQLFASALSHGRGQVSYNKEIEEELFHYCQKEILRHIPESRFFPIRNDDSATV